MALFARRTQRRASLTAAAVEFNADTPKPRISKQGWQSDVWAYRKMVPELGYSTRFIANAFRRMRFVIALEDEDGQPTAARDGDGVALSPVVDEAQDILRGLRAPIGGASALFAGLASKQWTVGEAFAVPVIVENETVGYEALSTSELVMEGKCRTEAAEFPKYGRKRNAGSQPEWLPCGITPVRFWTPDDEFGDEPDSCVRPLVELLEVMVLLTRALRGVSLSRLHSGVFVAPDQLDFPPLPGQEEPASLQEMLVEAFSAPIEDKAAAGAFTPFAFTAPADLIEHIRHIDLSKITDATVLMALRMQATTLFAQGVDLPVEVVTGHMQTTFANASQISRDLYSQHIEPLALDIGEGVASAIIRPRLGNTEDAQRVLVVPEPSGLVAKPDRSDLALRVARERPEAISNSALMDATGLPDEPMSDEELDRRISVAQAIRGGSESHREAGEEALAASVDVAVERAVRAAGARLRSRANGKLEATVLDGVPNERVAEVLGAQRVATLAGRDGLMAGEFEALSAVVERTHGPEAAQRAVAEAQRRAEAQLGGR